MGETYCSTFADRLSNFGRRKLNSFRGRPQRNYQRALIGRNWYDPSARSDMPMLFIGGCGRSGTTLLREMLNRHPNIFCGPETSMFGLPFWPNNIAKMWNVDEAGIKKDVQQAKNLIQYADNFYSHHTNTVGKTRAADKTPNNVRVISKLLTWFPEGIFIHVIRDCRDVVCSLRNHPKEIIINSKIVPNNINRPISECATRWLNDVSSGLVYRNHPRYYELRYEDLAAKPEATLRSLCDFIGEEYSAEMLNPQASKQDNMNVGRLVNNQNSKEKISTQSIGRWENGLNNKEKYDFIDIAGELLVTLGYTEDHTWAR